MCSTCGRLREVEAPARELVCVEREATSADGHGWRGELAPDDEGLEPVEVPIFCPICWEQEFGE